MSKNNYRDYISKGDEFPYCQTFDLSCAFVEVGFCMLVFSQCSSVCYEEYNSVCVHVIFK